ncbi:Hsp20/alpha crystallin family protein [Algoriphagus algorifonticola]|uniref:Hsp20/alpha crystallin family protein n=1 Tax=Algoriphagus algorifonticola TaxID=2593007 RepID=UPI00119DCBD1|nr:Hsp20/alpha crystallin family protein [Algoriphagus algorifonticola]
MKLTKYNPTSTEFPTTFSSMLDRFFNDNFIPMNKQFNPAVDISEDDKSFEIEFAVPGMKKSDFNIDLTEGRLTISGERKIEEKKEGKNYHSIETHFGSFSRSFYLPENVLSEKIEATYVDGVLKISIPKTEKKNLKSVIEVK